MFYKLFKNSHMKTSFEKITRRELHFLVNANTIFHPWHSYHEMLHDEFGVNHHNCIIRDYIVTTHDRSIDRHMFKSLYKDLRKYLKNDYDPAGGRGLHSHI